MIQKILHISALQKGFTVSNVKLRWFPNTAPTLNEE